MLGVTRQQRTESLRNLQSLSYSRNTPSFMDAEHLLLCSQEPASGSCHKPDESSPHTSTLFPYDPFSY
jgi:hypothetical protein